MMCLSVLAVFFVFVFKQKTAYEMRISDWSSDVCSSDLDGLHIETLHSHLVSADEDSDQNARQLAIFCAIRQAIPARRYSLANSAGVCQIGRASCRESVCQYGTISVVAGSLKKKTTRQTESKNQKEPAINAK